MGRSLTALFVGFGSLVVATMLGSVPAPSPSPPASTSAADGAPGITKTLPVPPVTFDAASALTFDARSKDGNPAASSGFRNEAARTTVRLRAILPLRDGSSIDVEVLPGEVTIGARDIRPQSLAFKLKDPSRGWLHHTPSADGSSRRRIPQIRKPSWRVKEIRVVSLLPSLIQARVFAWTFAVAALVIAVTAGLTPAWKAFDQMGAPVRTQSWASNAAIGGGMLTSLLALVAETTRYLNKTTYVVSPAVFAALVALAPVVYGLFRARQLQNPIRTRRQAVRDMCWFS